MATTTQTEAKTTYHVIDRQTGRVVGSYQNRNRARNKVDRLDNEYGAYRYFVQPVWSAGESSQG